MNWELFVEKIAEVLALALTDKESEMVVKSFHALTARIRELSQYVSTLSKFHVLL
jgi:hypothetical protein